MKRSVAAAGIAAMLSFFAVTVLAADAPPGPPEGACCHIGNAAGITHLGEYGWRCMTDDRQRAAAACDKPAASSPTSDAPGSAPRPK